MRLTFGAEIFDSAETHKVDALVLEFYDLWGFVGSLEITDKKSYSGLFTKIIQLNTLSELNKTQIKFNSNKSRDELVGEKKEVISNLIESKNRRGALRQVKGMNEDEIIKVIEEFDGYDINQLAEKMSEENRLKAIKLGIGKLADYEIEDLAKDMEEENRLEVISIAVKKLGQLGGFRIMRLAQGMKEENRLKVMNI